MSALTVLQVCGTVILALAYLLGSDGSTTSTVIGVGQLLAGVGMAVGARMEARRRRG
jgi:hypothetical protein